MYSDRKLNCNCKFIAIFILNRIGRGGYNCLSSTVSTSEEKSVRSKHRISFEDMYSCSIYCVDIKGKFHQQFVRKKRIQWTWEVALSPYLCQFRRLGIEFVDLEWFWNIPFSDVNGNWLHSITDAWNDMEWNWSMQLRTCSWRGQKLWCSYGWIDGVKLKMTCYVLIILMKFWGIGQLCVEFYRLLDLLELIDFEWWGTNLVC